ncbi:MAG: hypothetical protein AAFP90_23060, partial [Planctomycetota bacterium]
KNVCVKPTECGENPQVPSSKCNVAPIVIKQKSHINGAVHAEKRLQRRSMTRCLEGERRFDDNLSLRLCSAVATALTVFRHLEKGSEIV